jgi:hypothetical protein
MPATLPRPSRPDSGEPSMRLADPGRGRNAHGVLVAPAPIVVMNSVWTGLLQVSEALGR